MSFKLDFLTSIGKTTPATEFIVHSDTPFGYSLVLGGTGLTINWGDGSIDSTADYTGQPANHTYAAGTYTVRVFGPMVTFRTEEFGTNDHLTQVTKLGAGIVDMGFEGAQALISVPSSIPASVKYMHRAFLDCPAFNQNIASWNISAVENMDLMFSGASAFNQDLSSWVTGVVSQPSQFSQNANPAWVADMATKFPFLADGVTRVNT